ncbi:SDR family oxidoreductase [Marinigracilibium pacificum]|uniref:SDR family oxidoreductase n=1 Tax=Marinigracilibium pacificum TaxID=2729599 RepID=A0A848J128_9BACT|nr:SDR family oxidoreductase [Marinigracilibium pacificum]NMM46942.1 SDR family oxidoreductase [Marinigracilibium pacificum]
MKILLTGSTGYIGRRLLPELIALGHHIICPVRDKRRFDYEDFSDEELKNITVIECDLSEESGYKNLPSDFDIAYFLIHAMAKGSGFQSVEEKIARLFVQFTDWSNCQQTIYLSGIVNDENLSSHLKSRLVVENILKEGKTPLTVLRAAIIIGSGSASFEIIRDLCEKLPVMITPKWLKTLCQPIAIRNVIEYLVKSAGNEDVKGGTFDIGGPKVLSYKEMLLGYAEVRGLKRYIYTLPVMTPRLSSYWLYFVTSTNYHLAVSLVDSMKNEVVVQDDRIKTLIPVKLLSYKKAVSLALDRVAQNRVISSWKDTIGYKYIRQDFMDRLKVPQYGVFNDVRSYDFKRPASEVINNFFAIGGGTGWYYGNFLWEIRGLMDKMVGGVGLRRGRRDSSDLKQGDALDFWRVIVADREKGRLLLYAEMKLPGEAWLEFKIKEKNKTESSLLQTATFRPKGLLGRLYWYSVLPFHAFIFKGMAQGIINS